jgi:hypothetical protein
VSAYGNLGREGGWFGVLFKQPKLFRAASLTYFAAGTATASFGQNYPFFDRLVWTLPGRR